MSGNRMTGLALVGLFALFLALFLLISDDVIPGGLASRYTNMDDANEDSLVLLWEPGETIGISQNFQLATLAVSFILFVSIFAAFAVSKQGGKKS